MEKDGVRVTLRTTFSKREMAVLVKVSNLSDKPVLVSPDALEATTDGGYVISPARETAYRKNMDAEIKWNKINNIAAQIPFSSPYKIVNNAHKISKLADRAKFEINKWNQTDKGLLRDVILQPGMATHGLVVYDSSFARAFEEAPHIRIKVMIGEEPFEFQFQGR